MNNKLTWQYNTLAKAVTGVVLMGSAASSQALFFEFGDGGEWELDLDTVVSYSAQWRVANPDDNKIDFRPADDLTARVEKANADDGSRNFDKTLVQNKISAVTDMNLAWRNFGLFARGRANYDAVYNNDTAHNQRAYLTYNSAENYGGDAGFQEFPDGTVDEHRDRVEMLDYFLYAGGELPGDRLFDVRLGSQVINWGESTWYQGINGLQNPVDAIAANTPGVEVKEILLPTGAIYAQVDLAPDVTFEAYYQYEWKKTELNGVGSFFSTTDWLGPGASSYLIPLTADPQTGEPGLVLAAEKTESRASDSGQWGAALHWVTDGGTDFGLYYVNAHSKTPSFYPPSLAAGLVYDIDYFEDIQGYAVSFTSVWGITNIQGEISYKTDTPIVDELGDPGEGDLITAQLGGSYVLEPTAFWDDGNLTFEVAAANVESLNSDELRFDDTAAAFALRAEFSYINVYPGLDIQVPMFIQRTLTGVIREANMIEDGTTINFTVKGIYLNNFSAQVGYTTYFDGGHDNLLTDRDNLSLSVSYSF